MADGADKQQKRQRRAYVSAALSMTFLAMFAMAFIGIVVILNDYADKLNEEASPEIDTSEKAPDEPFYVLLIGSDSRKGTAMYKAGSGNSQESAYADIITLMRIDPRDYKITLVSVPRDTVLSGETGKINESLNTDDPQKVVEAVEELTGRHIDGYLMTTFISFENLVNALGGVDVDVPKTVKVIDPATGKNVTVKQGKNQHLNGSQALVLARARQEYEGNQDALRQVNVRGIERALIEKVLAMDGSFDVEHVLAAIDNDTRTNLDLGGMGLLMLQFVEHAGDVVIYDGTGTYEGGARPTDKAWVIPEDEEAWEQLMVAVDAGEDPSQLITPPSFTK